ncbi:hypothetical protein QQS21_002805 [Conoideocrella luteorostrata]|uniref:Rpr2-domain-containing protein n=1 Tax=Conoideocrella luteorostrata TaxID=1105319 RepID=A0AAJ0CX42_9HYPO|nr:hypothetical protein QQS21_002805 [Conoideocrella luteorostrata]
MARACCTSALRDASASAAKPSKQEHSASDQQSQQLQAIDNMSRLAITDMRAVSLKAQIRQSSSLKRTICKFCDTLLVEGRTCHSMIENTSKGKRKPWADVLVIGCKTCGNSKRYPVDMPRQKRKLLRSQDSKTREEIERIDGDKDKRIT